MMRAPAPIAPRLSDAVPGACARPRVQVTAEEHAAHLARMAQIVAASGRSLWP